MQADPQVSTSTGVGLSGGGVNIRQNAIQIDGAASGDLFGLGTTGQPGAQANAKSIPLDAVKEYQVLLSPFDVRQGNFGGVLINAVTKSGTNEFHGTAYGYTRNENLTRKQPYLAEFKQQQYGFSLGGPILKDRLFFFVNPEWQKSAARLPAGAYIGSPDSTDQRRRRSTVQYRLSRVRLHRAAAGASGCSGESAHQHVRSGRRLPPGEYAAGAAPQLRRRRQHHLFGRGIPGSRAT